MIYLPDPQYNPVHAKELNTNTLLQKGISISKFIKNTGNFYDYNNKTYNWRLRVAKQLYLQAEFMRSVKKPGGMFENFRLVVSEGLYAFGPKEPYSASSLNGQRQYGEAIVYELYDQYGKLATDNTFDLVNYLRITSRYNKLILAYDNFTGNGLNASVIAIMPKVSLGTSWDLTFKYDLETQYNNITQSTNEIVEFRV